MTTRMVKIRLGTTISLLVNLFLTFWLVNQYLNDAYFQTYVNTSIGPYSPFIVLTIGLGGGSGFGYILLKKRHGDQGLIGKIQKSKSFKPGSLLSTGTPTASPSRQTLPTGVPPSTGSKHTVYAVPPLPKSTTPSPRSTPSLSWSTSAKSSTDSFPAQKQDAVGKSASAVLQSLRAEASKPTSSQFQPTLQNQPSPTLRQPPEPSPVPSKWGPPDRSGNEAPMRQAPSPAWNPPPSTMSEGRSDSGPTFQKPGLDTSARQGVPFPSAPGQPQSSQTSPVPSKWGPPARPGAGPLPDTGGIRSIPPLPTKWSPPSGSPNPQGTPLPQGISRPGPMPMRPPVPPTQGPRPFVIQGPGRPGEQHPMAPPRPFGAGPPPRPPVTSTQPGPGQSTPRPSAPLGGPMPMPQPWRPPAQSPDKETSDSKERGDSFPDLSSPSQGTESKSPPAAGGGGEMDWDTALDTILKTLRKDRGVGESK
ncbi:MAG TPA: hypothetical protein VNA15_13155 [Candidatus Angelobacter sp.]|nr:hypothetical protein [Candidatus Angelobacter sp.]